MSLQQDNQSELSCYRCGFSLQSLTLPLSRRDQCPDCGVDLHVCRLCRNFAPGMPDDCREEDADAVRSKTVANFCDYFTPDTAAFDGSEATADAGARQQLAALFGAAESEADSTGEEKNPGPETDALRRAAEDLFGK